MLSARESWHAVTRDEVTAFMRIKATFHLLAVLVGGEDSLIADLLDGRRSKKGKKMLPTGYWNRLQQLYEEVYYFRQYELYQAAMPTSSTVCDRDLIKFRLKPTNFESFRRSVTLLKRIYFTIWNCCPATEKKDFRWNPLENLFIFCSTNEDIEIVLEIVEKLSGPKTTLSEVVGIDMQQQMALYYANENSNYAIENNNSLVGTEDVEQETVREQRQEESVGNEEGVEESREASVLLSSSDSASDEMEIDVEPSYSMEDKHSELASEEMEIGVEPPSNKLPETAIQMGQSSDKAVNNKSSDEAVNNKSLNSEEESEELSDSDSEEQKVESSDSELESSSDDSEEEMEESSDEDEDVPWVPPTSKVQAKVKEMMLRSKTKTKPSAMNTSNFNSQTSNHRKLPGRRQDMEEEETPSDKDAPLAEEASEEEASLEEEAIKEEAIKQAENRIRCSRIFGLLENLCNQLKQKGIQIDLENELNALKGLPLNDWSLQLVRLYWKLWEENKRILDSKEVTEEQTKARNFRLYVGILLSSSTFDLSVKRVLDRLFEFGLSDAYKVDNIKKEYLEYFLYPRKDHNKKVPGWMKLGQIPIEAYERDAPRGTASVFDYEVEASKKEKELPPDNDPSFKGIGIYVVKARYLKQGAKVMVDKYNGAPPTSYSAYKEIEGMKQKGPLIMIIEVYNFELAGIPVDIHVKIFSAALRLLCNQETLPMSSETGLCEVKKLNEEIVDRDLRNSISSKYWKDFNLTVGSIGQLFRTKKHQEDLLAFIKNDYHPESERDELVEIFSRLLPYYSKDVWRSLTGEEGGGEEEEDEEEE